MRIGHEKLARNTVRSIFCYILRGATNHSYLSTSQIYIDVFVKYTDNVFKTHYFNIRQNGSIHRLDEWAHTIKKLVFGYETYRSVKCVLLIDYTNKYECCLESLFTNYPATPKCRDS